MSLMKWEECMEKHVRRVNYDIKKSNSLNNTAKNRIKFLKTLRLNKNSATFIYEGYYTSLIEIIHTKAYERGYKILNHVCITAFIEQLYSHKESMLFDSLRQARK